MRRFAFVVTLIACSSLVLAGTSFARVPDPTNCTVTDCLINTCPIAHDPATAAASERECTLVVTLLNENFDPVEGFPAANFNFTVVPHSAYPALGGGPMGDCPGCENHYSVSTVGAATNIDGEIVILVDLGDGCAPSMCCPVEVWVDIPQGTIIDPGEVFQNSVDLVANGVVLGPDFSDFATRYGSTTEPCADFVWAPPGPPAWGTVDGSDFAMFGTHYTHFCEPFTDPCP